MKKCTGCGATKPFSEYTKHKLGRHGLRPRCKPCSAAENAEWKARNRETIREKDAAYRLKNREAWLAKNLAWNKANRDKCDAATLRWRERNPDLVLAQRHRHRVLRRNAPGAKYATGDKIAARIAYYDGKCFYCPADADTIDHRIPLARGGTGLPANLVPACRSCNSRKRLRTQREYQQVQAA